MNATAVIWKVLLIVETRVTFRRGIDGMSAVGRSGSLQDGQSGSNPVVELLKADLWSMAEVRTGSGVAMIRYRTPVLSGHQAEGYNRVLKIVWAYAPEGSGELPTKEQSSRMGVFEDRFCQAVEHDAHAALVAVLTFDGARQWVFYTSDVRECGARLSAMPQEAERYPIELTTERDPEWQYLHEQILKQVPWKKSSEQ